MDAQVCVKRCRVDDLSEDARWRIGRSEIRNLKNRSRSNEISNEIFGKRLRTIVDFISGMSDRIDSDGVVVEFYEGPEDSE